MNALDVLKSQHNQVKDMFKELGDTVDVNLQNRIIDNLSGHTLIEETIFYPALAEKEETKEFVEEAKQEHIEVNALVGQWQKTQNPPVWLETAEKIKKAVTHHIKEEEGAMFSAVKKAFTEEELNVLGSRMQA